MKQKQAGPPTIDHFLQEFDAISIEIEKTSNLKETEKVRY
jgi:hypothetical protein